MDECRIRGLITSPDDIKCVIKNAFLNDVNLDLICDWISYFHKQEWLDSDLANDYLSDLQEQHKMLQNAFYRQVQTNNGDDDESTDLGDLNPNEPLDVQRMINFLKPSQKATFDWCLSQLLSRTQMLASIFGCAGPGKSHLLHTLVSYMINHLSLNVTVIAPAGIAASLIDGTTVHHAFGLDHELETCIEGGSLCETELRQADVIIIDECSMMTQELFWKVQDLCHDTSHNDDRAKPFGGKHIILLGDPAQLPPIGMTFFRTALWMKFKVLLLKDVVRQVDPAFVKLLASLRNGEPTEHAIDMLQSRAATFHAVDPTTTTIVVSRRKTRDQLNEAFINQMGEAGAALHTYSATDTDIHCGLLPTRIQTTLRSKKYEKLALPQLLTICKGACVMLLRNAQIKQGWVNGTMCEVKTCTDDVIYVKNLRTGVCKSIFHVNQHISMHNGNFTACRKQFPIMLAFAIIVHKVQGSTLRRVAIICDDKFFTSGQMYTAISRVRNLDDLFCSTLTPPHSAKKRN